MKILLVDDDYLTIEAVKQMLNWGGFNGTLVGEAYDGRQALELMKETQPDVVISDIKMPQMDGIELAKEIFENYSACRTILISGHGEFEYAQKAVRYQVTDYILKPITRQKISDLNQRLVEIEKEISAKNDNYWYLCDEEFRETVLDTLRKGDMETLGELFVSDKVLSALSRNDEDTLGVQLLNYLFVYQQEIGKGSYEEYISKEQAIQEYRRLPNVYTRLTFLSTHYYDLMEYAQNKKTTYTNPVFLYCTKIIAEKFNDPYFNISTLADMLNLSLPYLSTLFKQNSGQNISRYLTSIRLECAKKLLQDISIPIKEVCTASGYEDPHYFTKAFKKQVGVTPTEYRNLSANRQKESDRAAL